MRLTLTLAASALALSLAACGKKEEAAAPKTGLSADTRAAMESLPKRQAGLWQETSTTAGLPEQIRVICIDEAMAEQMAKAGQNAGAQNCSENTMSKNSDGSYAFASTCAAPDGTVKITGKAAGDFATAYAVDMDVAIEGAAVAATNGKRTTHVDYRWLSACPDTMKPGDVLATQAQPAALAAK